MIHIEAATFSEAVTQLVAIFKRMNPNIDGVIMECMGSKVTVVIGKTKTTIELEQDPMTDEERRMRVRWFGASWGAPICDPEFQQPVPIGRPCIWCKKPIAEDDQGFLTFAVADRDPSHRDCFLGAMGIERPKENP